MTAMLEVSMICSATVIWFAVCVLLAVMWFPVEEKTPDQLKRRRAAAFSLFIVWLFIGRMFYQHTGMYVRFF